MGIAVNAKAYNGTPLTYAKINRITVNMSNRTASATLSGYRSLQDRIERGEPYAILVHTFQLPDQMPENITNYAYQRLSEEHPGLDWTQVDIE